MNEKQEKQPHNETGDNIMEQYDFRTIAETDALLWYNKDSGLYEPNGEAFLKRRVEIEMGKIDQSGYVTINYTREVIAI
jgi:hypothetical protein